MSKSLVLVGIGGFLGSISRYLAALFIARMYSSVFPYGTFIVNIVGCFLIGLFYGLSKQLNWFSPEWSLFLATGFCGGFTTFSSFAYENLALLQRGDYFIFAAYSISSFVLGIVAAFAGLFLIRTIM